MAVILARAYNEKPGRGPNFSVPSSPGRRVEFHGNMAHLTTDADIQAVMSDPYVTIEPEGDWFERVLMIQRSLGENGHATVHGVAIAVTEPEPEMEAPKRARR